MNSKKGKMKLSLRSKWVADTMNKILDPFEKFADYLKKAGRKAKEKFPEIYENLENIAKKHIVTPNQQELKSGKIEDVGSFITANVIKRLPNIDESKVNEILNKPSDKSFLDILTKGLGLDLEKKRTYTVLKKNGFKRILVANRGEIALRIIRACKELDIESVVIYSEEEKNSLAVKFADRSYNIGKPKNYLDINKIVKMAKKKGCDAIHPGYGFLSENPEFARICEKRKIKFIGPSSKMIEKLGNKVEARNAMLKLGIPVIEGVHEDLKGKEHALKIANKIGFPVIIKASSGGGGKGMRVVTKEKDLENAFESASKEAFNAFGDKSVYMERYIEEPRHIEFQILADKYGNVIHLGERDCSIQRRHQKLIEEAPSPALDTELRKKMGDAAVNGVKAIGYEGAGTIEFLLDKSGNFYFIEMNTRIQVEHGVTELVTGVDLVKEQIKLAEGAQLAFKQEDIKIDGHAIECRINADDPYNNFAPCPGEITNYLPPGGPGIRISSSTYTGYKILPHFDSLIALLICYGKDRDEAIDRMQRALGEFIVEGVKTTIPFHQAVFENRQFLKGNFTTSFIERNKIMQSLKSEKSNKEISTKEKQILIITTAVGKHLVNKSRTAKKLTAWGMAARQESIGNFEE
jgi:acetyl-CoA carboxylase biotin carboxylase subunit